MRRLPHAWIGVLYAAVVWVPVIGTFFQNVRDALSRGDSVLDWIIMLLLWAAGSIAWMFLCDWVLNRIGVALGWWPSGRR
jgi:hypothetical protein